VAKLTFYLGGQPVEFEGSVVEIAEFLKTIQTESIHLDMSEDTKIQRDEQARERALVAEVKRKLPNVDEVIKYIMNQEDYRHRTFDIMEHFFGRTFKARGVTEGLYHDFLRLASEARERIESGQEGEFDHTLELGRHKVWEWWPITRKRSVENVEAV